MSNIGKQPIQIPDNTEVVIKGSSISVKGKLGELTLDFDTRIKISNQNNLLTVTRETNKRKDRELHGLYRALINNMVDSLICPPVVIAIKNPIEKVTNKCVIFANKKDNNPDQNPFFNFDDSFIFLIYNYQFKIQK